MAALYPAAPPVFSQKVNLQDVVNAPDVNTAYDEITAIAAALGLFVNSRQGSFAVATEFKTSTGTTVQQRLENVENGAYWALSNAVRNTGDTSITTPSGTTDKVNLTVTGSSGQTANLLTLRKTVGSTVSTVVSIDTTGKIVNGIIDGGVEL